MRDDFILRAHKVASDERKKEIAKEYYWLFEVKEKDLVLGNWYRCEELVSGCLGFSGTGKHISKPHISIPFSGLPYGIFLQKPSGTIWGVKGKFYPEKPIILKNRILHENNN